MANMVTMYLMLLFRMRDMLLKGILNLNLEFRLKKLALQPGALQEWGKHLHDLVQAIRGPELGLGGSSVFYPGGERVGQGWIR